MSALFTDGMQGSAGAWMSALLALQAQGQSVLDSLTNIQQETLVRLLQDLNALDGRRTRLNRIARPGVAGQLVLSDFEDVDQTQTSGAVRAESGSFCLRERNYSAEAVISQTVFSTSAGSFQPVGSLYQVYDPGGTPTGQFDLTFLYPVDITLAVFELVLSPSQPALAVSGSSDGVFYTPATLVSQSGPSVNVFMPAGSYKYLRVAVTPAHPDNIGGATYTFGLSSFSAFTIQYELASSLLSKTLQLIPSTANFEIVFSQPTGVSVSLALNGGAFAAVSPQTVIPVPGAAPLASAVTVTTGGILTWLVNGVMTAVLPGNVYTNSLQITDSSGNTLPLAPGLNPISQGLLLKPVIAVFNGVLTLCGPAGAVPARISYLTGPSSVAAQLLVEMTTEDRTQTPVFAGAVFNCV